MSTTVPDTEPRRTRARLAVLLLDVVAPLALFYGLRACGVNQWAALVLSGLIPTAVLVHRLVRERRVETLTLVTLSILVCGTVVGLLTGDPRLLLARESYLTGLLGLWILGTLVTARPFLLQATLPLLPPRTARSWNERWQSDPVFRRVVRTMTLAWGAAFLVDAAARVVMAYTLPVDVVPVAGGLLLAAMLVAVVQGGKAYGRRVMRRTTP